MGEAGMDKLFVEVCQDCFRIEGWTNGYVVRTGDVGLCIDAPAGGWVDRLGQIGISHIAYVLATHHHRDTLASADLLVERGAELIVPTAEAALIGQVEQFWQTARTYVLYNCDSQFFSLRQSIPVARTVGDGDELDLLGRAVRVMGLPGHTRGSVGYVLDVGGRRLFFIGDNMSRPGQVHNWHDLHWDYMDFNTGAKALREAMGKVRPLEPTQICPAHAPVIDQADEALARLDENLGRFAAAVESNRIPRPYGEYRQITDHVHYLGMTTYVIIADSGKGFIWDFGYVPETRQRIEHLTDQAGLKRIDVLTMSHYHDDHILRMAEVAYALGKDHTQPRAQIWCHRVLYDVLTRPYAYRLPCLVPSPLVIDRVLDDGRFVWEGIEMELLHMPGQTWWHAGLIMRVDGRTIAFTGDDIWRPEDRSKPINGPIISRNRYLPGRGHDLVAKQLIERNVDMICSAHNEPFEVSRQDLAGYARWARQANDSIVRLAGSDRLGVDPWWCRIDPFHIYCRPDRPLAVSVLIDSPFDEPATIDVGLCVPPGFSAQTMQQSVFVAPGQCEAVRFSVKVADDLAPGRRLPLTAMLTVNGQPWGELCEALVIPLPE
jgi:glyoxylase-like metal-dependent hydrolase (beta-lactamase superfamily II)